MRPAATRRRAVWLLLLAFLCLGALAGCQDRFRIAVDPMRHRCLPYAVYLIDRGNVSPERDALFAFASIGLEPIFRDGTPFIKIMAGLPGDRVDVDATGIRVAGRPRGTVDSLVLARTGLSINAVTRHASIQPGRFLMLGTLPLSFDGRYWGDIAQGQLIARAYPLW